MHEDPPSLEEMELAFDELHGCMIRRPEATCEVRKEFLATALYALDQQQRAARSVIDAIAEQGR